MGEFQHCFKSYFTRCKKRYHYNYAPICNAAEYGTGYLEIIKMKLD